MGKIFYAALLAAFCFALPCHSEDVRPLLLTQQELENEINTCVDNLIAQSALSTENLLRAMTNSENVSSEVEALKKERDDLNTLSAATSASLNESRTQIIKLSQSLNFWRKFAMQLSLLLLTLIAVFLTLIILEKTHRTDFL